MIEIRKIIMSEKKKSLLTIIKLVNVKLDYAERLEIERLQQTENTKQDWKGLKDEKYEILGVVVQMELFKSDYQCDCDKDVEKNCIMEGRNCIILNNYKREINEMEVKLIEEHHMDGLFLSNEINRIGEKAFKKKIFFLKKK